MLRPGTHSCRNCKEAADFPTKLDVIRGMSIKSTLKGRTMSETNKANTVAFHKKAVFEGDVASPSDGFHLVVLMK
jgi:hypothetical protein